MIRSILLLSVFALTEGFQSSFVSVRNNGVVGAPKFARSSCSLSMSTIAVIGASGLTSRECVYQALERGCNVVGLTR